MKKLKFFTSVIVMALALAFVGCKHDVVGGNNSENSNNPGNQENPNDPPARPLYQFHETVTVLPAGTDGTAGTSATYVLFGDWPQTIKASDVEVDESQSVTMGANTYYLGSDNNYYAKCTERGKDYGYTYSDGTTVALANRIRYFKVEPIKWRVLTDNYDGKKLLLAENILTAKIPYYEYFNVNRYIDGMTVYSNNYKESGIRAYLNGYSFEVKEDDSSSQTTNSSYLGKGFLQSAFTASAQGRIADTTVDNSARSTNPDSNQASWNNGDNIFACDNTEDKIFLLSEEEATKNEYGFSAYNQSGIGNNRIRMTTDYAKANYAYQYPDEGRGGWWWLRSPHYYSFYDARSVSYDGDAHNDDSVDLLSGGVCPALTLK